MAKKCPRIRKTISEKSTFLATPVREIADWTKNSLKTWTAVSALGRPKILIMSKHWIYEDLHPQQVRYWFWEVDGPRTKLSTPASQGRQYQNIPTLGKMNLTSPGHIYCWDLFRVRTTYKPIERLHITQRSNRNKKIMVKLHYTFLSTKITCQEGKWNIVTSFIRTRSNDN